jgi:transposase
MSKKRRLRRLWEDDEKIQIVAQTRVPGVSVSQVARRYDVNANLVFRWLRDPRFNRLSDEEPTASFLPVEVVAEPQSLDPPVINAPVGGALPLRLGRRNRRSRLCRRRAIASALAGRMIPRPCAVLCGGWVHDPRSKQYAGLACGWRDGHAARF